MQCSACGTKNKDYYHYCYFCGQLLTDEQAKSTQEPERYMRKDNIEDAYIRAPKTRQRFDSGKRRTINFLRLSVSVFILLALSYASFMAVTYLLAAFIPNEAEAQRVTADILVTSTEVDGVPTQRIIVQTAYGDLVETLGRSFPVNEGTAEILFENAYLHSRFPQAQQENGIPITLEIIIFRDGQSEYIENFEFVMVMPPVPLTLIQPREEATVVEDDTYIIIFDVMPGASVFINGDEYSDLVSADGRFQKEIILESEDVTSLDVRAVARGFEDSQITIVLSKREMIVPITLDMEVPISTPDEWAEIRGRTSPNAAISTDLEIQNEIVFDNETGEFSFRARAPTLGLTPGTITATLSDGQTSQIPLAIFRETTADVYTRRAWSPNFNSLLADPSLNNGQIFLITGTITDILLRGRKNDFVVNISSDAETQHLFFVEFWGNFDFETGDSIRVFGNRWGNHNDMVRILAPFVYR